MYKIKKATQVIYTAIVLGATLSAKTKLVFAAFYFPLKRALGLKGQSDFIILIRKFGRVYPIHVTDGSDIGVLKEVFVDEQYDVHLPSAPQTILDLGSNVGFSVVYFKLRYPEATVYACEPDPDTFKKLQKNTSALQKVSLFNIAIGKTDGMVNFFIHPTSSMSSSLIARGPTAKHVSVVSKTLHTLLAELGIGQVDLLKFDVEGAEFQIFQHFPDMRSIKALIGELHFDLMGVDEDTFMKLFNDFSITKEKTGTKRVLATFIPV